MSEPVAPDLSRLLASFASRKVVVLGDLVADHYIYGQTDRVSREAPVLVVRHESSEVTLGGAANAAANARALGAEVVAVGVLGRDEMGAQLRTAFAQHDVQLAAVELPPLVTETKTRILAGGLNTTRQQMLRLDRGNPLPLPPVVGQALAVALERAVVGADAVLVSDYGGGVVGEATRAVLSRLRKQGVRVVVDSRYALGTLQGFSAAKPNEPELAALTGLPVDDDRAVEQAAQAAQRTLGRGRPPRHPRAAGHGPARARRAGGAPPTPRQPRGGGRHRRRGHGDGRLRAWPSPPVPRPGRPRRWPTSPGRWWCSSRVRPR